MYKTAGLTLSLLLASGFAFATDSERAKEIVMDKCYLCHGSDGQGSSAIYPRLAGQNPDYIAKQLADFKSGKRKGTMNEMAADLTPEEMTLLGAYFSAQPTKAHRVRDKQLAAVGEYIFQRGNKYSGVAPCKSCHGEDGKGTQALPRLAGQHKRYLMIQLQEFNKRTRTNDNAIMGTIAEKLTELEIEAVATYISGMNSEPEKVTQR